MNIIGRWLLSGAGLGLVMTNALPAATFNVPKPASLSASSTAGGLKLTYRGATNFQSLIHGSSNLLNWSLLSSNVATNQIITFLDTQATNRSRRFYKATSLPTPFLYQGTFSGSERGAFILLARTNNTATFLGINTPTHQRGEYASALVVGTNDLACGTYILGAPGCLQFTSSNTVSGKFTNVLNQTGTLTGVQKANAGIFSSAAGLYTGPVTDGHSGGAKLLLCPDGAFAFYRTDSDTGGNDGGVSSMNSGGIVDVYLSGSASLHLAGSFNILNRTFSLTIHESDGLYSLVSMTLSEPLF